MGDGAGSGVRETGKTTINIYAVVEQLLLQTTSMEKGEQHQVYIYIYVLQESRLNM